MNYFPLINYQYMVKKDDTLYILAKRFNLRVETLKKVNPLIKNDVLEGQIINIPLKNDLVNKINQINYTLNINKHENLLKVQSILLSNHLYRTLLIKDLKNGIFNSQYYDKYISLKDELSDLVPVSVKNEYNITNCIQKILELWVELIRGQVYTVEDNFLINSLAKYFHFKGEDYILRIRKILCDYQTLVLNHGKMIMIDNHFEEIKLSEQIVKKISYCLSLIDEISE